MIVLDIKYEIKIWKIWSMWMHNDNINNISKF